MNLLETIQYKIRYWKEDLSKITGLPTDSEISGIELLSLHECCIENNIWIMFCNTEDIVKTIYLRQGRFIQY